MAINTDETIKIFRLSIFGRSKKELLRKIDDLWTNSSHTTYIFTPNPEQIVQAYQDQNFYHHLTQANINIPDGIGLVAASRLLHFFKKTNSLQQRISGTDLVKELLLKTKHLQLPILIIGGRDYNQLIDSGSHLHWLEGYQDIKHPTTQEEQKIEQTIRQLRPAIVFVAFGAPVQEDWLISHRSLLEQNQVKIGMAVGGAFDFILGKVKRAPGWMQKIGLEWLYRLVNQPWRWRRQLKLIQFIGLTIRELYSSSP